MILYCAGNILNHHAEALVNPVNCVSTMGAGLALEFKKRFPANFLAYKQACDNKLLQLGTVFIWENNGTPKYIINFPTKYHWKEKSEINQIVAGLFSLKREIVERNISSIAIPALGCGLGGLSWNDVENKINVVLSDLSDDVKIYLFGPKKS